jgi:broad specificity phosphatase PhoE
MKVIFIRHADLKYPYNDYDRLSLKQLDLLATEKTQPHINDRLARSKIKTHLADGFLVKNGVDAICYSSAPRAKQTAAILADMLNVSETKELDYLREIGFSPKKLVSSLTFKRSGMNAVREAVYRAIEQDTADETTKELVARIGQIKKLLDEHKSQTIVVVTHGFFMRLLQIALLHNKLTFSVSDQKQAVNHDYLQGFTYIQGENND